MRISCAVWERGTSLFLAHTSLVSFGATLETSSPFGASHCGGAYMPNQFSVTIISWILFVVKSPHTYLSFSNANKFCWIFFNSVKVWFRTHQRAKQPNAEKGEMSSTR